jgi:hypothetical protein
MPVVGGSVAGVEQNLEEEKKETVVVREWTTIRKVHPDMGV